MSRTLRVSIPKRKKEVFLSHSPSSTPLDIKAFARIKKAGQFFKGREQNTLIKLFEFQGKEFKFLPRVYHNKSTWKSMTMKRDMYVGEDIKKYVRFSKLNIKQREDYYTNPQYIDNEARFRVDKALQSRFVTKLENGSYLAFVRVKNGKDHLVSTKYFRKIRCSVSYFGNIYPSNFSEIAVTGRRTDNPNQKAFIIPFSIDHKFHTADLLNTTKKVRKSSKYMVEFVFEKQFSYIEEKWKLEISIGNVFSSESEVRDRIIAGKPYLFSLLKGNNESKVTVRCRKYDKFSFRLTKKNLPIQVIDLPTEENAKTREYEIRKHTKFKQFRAFQNVIPKPILYPFRYNGYVGRSNLELRIFEKELKDLKSHHTIYPCSKARQFIELKMQQKRDWKLVNNSIRQLLFLVTYYLDFCEHTYLKREPKKFMVSTDMIWDMFPKEFDEWVYRHYDRKPKSLSIRQSSQASARRKMLSSPSDHHHHFSKNKKYASARKKKGIKKDRRGETPPEEISMMELLEILDNMPELLDENFVCERKDLVSETQKKIRNNLLGPSAQDQSVGKGGQGRAKKGKSKRKGKSGGGGGSDFGKEITDSSSFLFEPILSRKMYRNSFTGFKVPDRPDKQVFFLLYNLLFRSDNLHEVVTGFDEKNENFELNSISELLRKPIEHLENPFVTTPQQKKQQHNKKKNNKKKKNKRKRPKKKRQYKNEFFEDHFFETTHGVDLINKYDRGSKLSTGVSELSMLLEGHYHLIPFLCRQVIPKYLKSIHTQIQPIIISYAIQLDLEQLQLLEEQQQQQQQQENNNKNNSEDVISTPSSSGLTSPLNSPRRRGRIRRSDSMIRSVPQEFRPKKSTLLLQKKKKKKKQNNNNKIKKKKNKIKKKIVVNIFNTPMDMMIEKYKDRNFEELRERFGETYKRRYESAREESFKLIKEISGSRIIEHCRFCFSMPGIRDDVLESFGDLGLYTPPNQYIFNNDNYLQNQFFLLQEKEMQRNNNNNDVIIGVSSSSNNNNKEDKRKNLNDKFIREEMRKYDEDLIFGKINEDEYDFGYLNDHKKSKIIKKKKNKKIEEEEEEDIINDDDDDDLYYIPTTFILRRLCRFCRKVNQKYDNYIRRLNLLINNQLILVEDDEESEEEESEEEEEEMINDYDDDDDEISDNSLEHKRLRQFQKYRKKRLMSAIKKSNREKDVSSILRKGPKFDVLETKIEILLQEKLNNAMNKTEEVYNLFRGKYVDTAKIQLRLKLWDILEREEWKNCLRIYEKKGRFDLSLIMNKLKFLRQREDMKNRQNIQKKKILEHQKLLKKKQKQKKYNLDDSEDESSSISSSTSFSSSSEEIEGEDNNNNNPSSSSSSSSSSSEEIIEEELKPFEDYRKNSTLEKVNTTYNSGRNLEIFSPREGLSSEIEIHLESALKSLRKYHQSITRFNPLLGPKSKLFSSRTGGEYKVMGGHQTRQGLVFHPVIKKKKKKNKNSKKNNNNVDNIFKQNVDNIGGNSNSNNLCGRTKKEKIIQKLLDERNHIFSEFNQIPFFSRIIRRQVVPSLESAFYHGFNPDYKKLMFFKCVTSIWELSEYYFGKNNDFRFSIECVKTVFPSESESILYYKKKEKFFNNNNKNINHHGDNHHHHHHQKKEDINISKEEEFLNTLKFRSLVCCLMNKRMIGKFFQQFSSHPRIQSYYSQNSIIRQETVRREILKKLIYLDDNFKLDVHFELNLVKVKD